MRALTHALDTQRLHHAWLFTGTRGVGKTTLSRILAKSLNCETGITSKPCGVCRACTDIDAGRFVDYVELDAASNRGVDEMTQLLEQAIYAPSAGRFKVYMIDEVHMLTGHAFNAMLKTLEEPPPHVKFILATTDPQKIPVTVLSRCLQFNLKQMPPDSIVGHLEYVLGQEDIPFEVPALRLIGQAAAGSMRDALSLTDQAIAYAAGNLTFEAVSGMLGAIDQRYLVRLLQALQAGQARAVLDVADELSTRGLSYRGALSDLASLLSRIAVAQRLPSTLDTSDTLGQDIAQLATQMHPDMVQLFYTVAVHSRAELSLAPDEYAGFVMTCLRMLSLRGDEPVAQTAGAQGAGQAGASNANTAAATPVAASAPVAATDATSATSAAFTTPATSTASSPSAVAPAGARPQATMAASTVAAAQQPVEAVSPESVAPTATPSVADPSAASAVVTSVPAQSAPVQTPAQTPVSDGALTASPDASTPAQAAPPTPIDEVVPTLSHEHLDALSAAPARSPAVESVLADRAPHAPATAVAIVHESPASADDDGPPPWFDEGAPDDGAGFMSAEDDGFAPADTDDEFETVAPPMNEAATARVAALPTAPRSVPSKAGSSARLAKFSATQWPTLAAELPVRGLASELARQSEWISVAGTVVTLRVAVQALADSAARVRVQTVLSEHFGQSVSLKLEVGEPGAGRTAHAVAVQERERAQRQAEDAVLTDPFVTALVSDFGGRVIEGSISPPSPRPQA